MLTMLLVLEIVQMAINNGLNNVVFVGHNEKDNALHIDQILSYMLGLKFLFLEQDGLALIQRQDC